MHYQVSRNGQTYGPYTLEDLQRYVGTGNVLPTDLAKSEDMPDWLPVSQILGSQSAPGQSAFGQSASGQSAPGQSAPFQSAPGQSAAETPFNSPFGAPPVYAEPANAGFPAAAASSYPDAPNLHWGIYLLLAIVTCTLFSKVFTVVQAAWLKRVQPNSNGIWFYVGLYTLWIVSLFYNLGHGLTHLAHSDPYSSYRGSHGALSLVYFILLFVTRFVMSTSLEEHFNGPEPIGLKLNPVMTFFFGGVYFQSQLNRINALKQAARYGAPRAF